MKRVTAQAGSAHVARALLILFLGCAMAACYFFPREEKVPAPPLVAPPAITYTTVEMRPGPIVQSVIVPGSFVYADYAKLSFPSRGGWLKSIRVQMGDKVKAGEVIAELDTESLANRIEQQKLLVRKAELSVERTRILGKDQIELEMAQIDVDLARLQLQDLQTQLAESRITSPLSGVVVYLIATRGGIAVDAYRTIAQVADPSRLLLIYKGDKAVEFRAGMKVSVSVGEKSYRGTIVMTPATTPPDAMQDLQNAVLVELPRLPPGVTQGDTATITLEKARKDGVLTVPRDAVTSFEGRTFVQVLEGGIKKDRSVELGIRTDTLVEVRSGLAAGDQVVNQ
jgi:macrolide-specific efflux system membrane fusion protein